MGRTEATGKREVSPFQTLASTAGYAIEKAEESERGSTLETLTAMLMSSMMVEAVLNHVGAQIFHASGEHHLWTTVERSRPEDKLTVICERIGYSLDFSREPFQCFRPMFKFRNLIAHGKTEVIVRQFLVDVDEYPNILRHPEFMPEWEKQCTIDNAHRFFDAADAIAWTLCRESGVQYPITHGSYGRSWKETTND